jgi:hypothetical protein
MQTSLLESEFEKPVTYSEDNCGHGKNVDSARPGNGKSWSKPSAAVKFFCGNPSVETTEGIIHLYKEKYAALLHFLMPWETQLIM